MQNVFWRLDHLFADVGMVRGNPVDDVARLQDGQPGLGGIVRDSGITAQRRQIDFLPGASGAELEKACKTDQIADIHHLPDIPLHVGGDIIGKPLGGGNIPVIDPWIAALPE